MIDIFSNYLGIKAREIGYAGLKDKNGLTTQYISLPAKFEEKLEKFSNENIKIVEKIRHKNKIRRGHLKGNRFFIRLKKVNPTDAKKITQVLKQIKTLGIPNYFGYQRFGNDGDNYLLGKDIIDGKTKMKDKKKKDFLISSYQSHLFNLALSKRVELSKMIESFNIQELVSMLNMPLNNVKLLKEQKHFFKTLAGDLFEHYPYGKLFFIEDIKSEADKFYNKDRVPTGLICGKKVKKSVGFAREYEKDFDEDIQLADGSRRFSWIFPEDIEGEYVEENAWFNLHFTLPKGSYATVFLEEILHKPLDMNGIDIADDE